MGKSNKPVIIEEEKTTRDMTDSEAFMHDFEKDLVNWAYDAAKYLHKGMIKEIDLNRIQFACASKLIDFAPNPNQRQDDSQVINLQLAIPRPPAGAIEAEATTVEEPKKLAEARAPVEPDPPESPTE